MYDSAKSELLKFVSKLGLKIVILIGTFSQNVLITVLKESSSSSDYYRCIPAFWHSGILGIPALCILAFQHSSIPGIPPPALASLIILIAVAGSIE